MSNNMNNFMPLSGAWQPGVRTHDAHTFNNIDSNEVPVFYRSRSTQATDNRFSGVLDPWHFGEDRTPTRFHSIPNYPAQPHSRRQFYVLYGDMGSGFNPMLRDILRQSPPRSTRQTNTQVSPLGENSRSTALNKLKKVVYNPYTPKWLARRLCSYHRDNALNALQEREKEMDEDGKRCAICLEDFEPREEVMVTPCNHMFHEDCIVPWLTSKGQCPVCRFVICERVRGNPSSFNINDIDSMEPSDLFAGELLSILRAMEEAFQSGNGTH